MKNNNLKKILIENVISFIFFLLFLLIFLLILVDNNNIFNDLKPIQNKNLLILIKMNNL